MCTSSSGTSSNIGQPQNESANHPQAMVPKRVRIRLPTEAGGEDDNSFDECTASSSSSSEQSNTVNCYSPSTDSSSAATTPLSPPTSSQKALIKAQLDKTADEARRSLKDGKWQMALFLHEQCYDSSRQLLGEKHPLSLQYMTSLALCHQTLRQYEQSAVLLSKCVKLRKEVVRDCNYSYEEVRHKNGDVVVIVVGNGSDDETDEDDEDKIIDDSTLNESEQQLERPSVARALLDTVHSLYRLAVLYHQQADIEKDSHIDSPLDKLNTDTGVNLSFSSYQNKYSQAATLYEECLGILGHELGLSPKKQRSIGKKKLVVGNRQNLGLGPGFGVVDVHEEAEIDLCTNPVILTILYNLATIYDCQGRYFLALSHFRDCLRGRQNSLGYTHPETLQVMYSLALCHLHRVEEKMTVGREVDHRKEDDESDIQEAQRLNTECLQERQIILGENHIDTISTVHSLGRLYLITGKFEVAAPLLVQAFSKRMAILGDSHQETVTSMYSLGMLYEQQGSVELSIPLYRECCSKRCKKLGDNHPLSLQVRTALSRALITSKGGKKEEHEIASAYEKSGKSSSFNFTILYE